MTKILLIFCISIATTIPSFGNGSIINSLVKRENIENVQITYLDNKTRTFFEDEVQWDSKGWPSKENPFKKHGRMDLKAFLETFDLLIPTGAYDGIDCKDIYGVSGGHFFSTASVCTVKYTKYDSVWFLKMMVESNSWGNAVSGARISSDFFVGLRVE